MILFNISLTTNKAVKKHSEKSLVWIKRSGSTSGLTKMVDPLRLIQPTFLNVVSFVSESVINDLTG